MVWLDTYIWVRLEKKNNLKIYCWLKNQREGINLWRKYNGKTYQYYSIRLLIKLTYIVLNIMIITHISKSPVKLLKEGR